MSEDNKQLVRRWFEQVWDRKNEAAIDEMYHPEGKAYGFPDPESVLVGPEAYKAVYRTFLGAFPDLKVHIDDVIAEGNHVAVRWHVEATHEGNHLGFPATGKRASLAGSSFVTVRGHQIIDGWNFMNVNAMVEKLKGGDESRDARAAGHSTEP